MELPLAAAITVALTVWVLVLISIDLKEKLGGRLSKAKKLSASYWGMQIAHAGLAICVLGVGLSSVYDQTRELRMQPGDSAQVAQYSFNLWVLSK